jgi:predicted DNA-binding transcriptional regulator YafY
LFIGCSFTDRGVTVLSPFRGEAVVVNRTDRLHAIHEALRRARSGAITAARLAEDLEVSVRTIKRDVSALQQSGAPIWAQPGPGGGYVLDVSASLPPVAFTPSQAVSIAVALAVLPPGSPFSVDAATAAAKVLDTLGPAARTGAEALAQRVWVLPAQDFEPASPGVLRAIERSLAERLALTIDYRDDRGNKTRRTIEPIMAAWGNERWYLVAHCRMRDGIRWFRTDRIEHAWPTRETYQPRPIADLGTPPPTARPAAH